MAAPRQRVHLLLSAVRGEDLHPPRSGDNRRRRGPRRSLSYRSDLAAIEHLREGEAESRGGSQWPGIDVATSPEPPAARGVIQPLDLNELDHSIALHPARTP